ncbi:MAG: cation:proton antiporter [Fibromonadales bacterium]|nr:cation:proton antiporter [Fibromonadales bacterium]
MEFEFFFQIALILLSTKFAGDLSVKLGQPSVLGKLIVGIVIGPAVLGWIENSELLTQLSNVGVILLMFIAGLETDLKELNENRNSSLAVAVGGIILPFVGGYAASLVMKMEQDKAVFLGLLLCATSVSISVQTLRDLGKMKTRESTTILGAAVFDDILVVILLAFAMNFLGTNDISLTFIILKKVAFFVSIILISWKGVPIIMRWLSPSHTSSESTISAALIICFSFAYFSESLGIAGIIGAFVAGIAVSQTNYKHEVEKSVEPIAYTMFVPVFFVSIGMRITFDGIGDRIWFTLALTVIAVLTKLIGCGFGAKITGFDIKSSAIIGAGMVSRGEVALIIAAMGLSSGLLAQDYFTAIVIVVILTTMITPPMLKYAFGVKDKPKTAP